VVPVTPLQQSAMKKFTSASAPELRDFDAEIVTEKYSQKLDEGLLSNIEMTIFDLGGQTVFDTIHHLFLTRFVYVLLTLLFNYFYSILFQ
jgi:hypothetical protein